MTKDPEFVYLHTPHKGAYKTTKHRVLKKARKYFHVDRIPADIKDRPSTWYGYLTATVNISDLERGGKAQDSRKSSDDWYWVSPKPPSAPPPSWDWRSYFRPPHKAPSRECFKVLGLSDKAGLTDIKAAFRKLAHRHHPDLGGEAEQFKRVRAAYEEAVSLRGGKQ